MKQTKARITAVILALAMVLALCPVSAFADSDQITATVNIYVNDRFKVSTTVYDYDDGIWTMEYGSFPFGWLYGDAYGKFLKGSASVNGRAAYFFCFDGENASFFKADFSGIVPDDQIVINLFYEAEEEEPEVVLGTVRLNISDGRN